MKQIKSAVMALDDYSVLQEYRLIKLNQNESPYDLPAELKREVMRRLLETGWNRYPELESRELIRRISHYTGFPDSGIVIGNGSNELIQACFMAFCKENDRVVVVKPGFSIYPRIARIMGANLVEVALGEHFKFDAARIIKEAEDAKMVIFSSPNNPTGTVMETDDVARIAGSLEAVVIVDEAYFEFHKKTCQQLIEKFGNLVVIRTFSKAFGLAGIRLGYLLSTAEFARGIRKVRLPFSVGVFQQTVAEVVLEHRNYLHNTVEEIIANREVLFRKLGTLSDIIPTYSRANFILFETKKKKSEELFQALYQKGVLVRIFDDPSLHGMLRVTVGRPAENQFFIKRLNEVLNE